MGLGLLCLMFRFNSTWGFLGVVVILGFVVLFCFCLFVFVVFGFHFRWLVEFVLYGFECLPVG